MVMKCKKNYYEILGVTPDSDAVEVKTSYRRLARKYHPDVNKSPDSCRLFKDVLEAYETLSDSEKRKQYNMLNGFYKTPKREKTESQNETCSEKKYSDYKHEQENSSKDFEPAKEQSSQPKDFNSKKNSYKNEQYHKTYSDSFLKKHINSILDEISRSHKEKQKKDTPKDGEDISTEIIIPFSESITGTERVLNIMHKELCPHCKGRRFINGAKCSKCKGSGVFEQRRKITVKIPAGVKNNGKLRIVGEGNPGFFGGQNGNLYITIKVDADKNIKVEGNNVLYSLPISPFEAVLGAEIELPSFDGNIKFILPAMTNSGQKFRIANKGLKTNNDFGDMIVTVEIQLPKDLSDEEISMYSKLKKMSKTCVRETD